MDLEQITTFVDDVTNQVYNKPGIASYERWLNFAEDEKIHSVSSILKRPVIVQEGTFSSATAATPGNSVVSVKFPDKLFDSSNNLVQKLNYFLYFRANVHIKIVFNATPFMQGKYWCMFVPFESQTNRNVQSSIQNQTGFNGTELDICSGAPVNLVIPYCSTLSHYNLITTESTMGTLYITTLNPITSGESTTKASYTIFAWFEDIELHVPTSKPVSVPEIFEAQIFTEENTKTNGAPISGVMSTIGSVAKNISGISPKLASISKPVEWISRFLSGGLAASGFNKPTSLSQNISIENFPGKYFTNADGVDRSVKLATMPDNSLVQHSGMFSSVMDEMDINYIASKSCVMISNAEWKTTDVAGTVLKYMNVTPGSCASDPTLSNTYNTTMLAFIASMFTYWRGGIKYRFAVSKTAYHSGRLRISFHPGIYNSTDTGDSSFVYNKILDLSISSEIEFVVPYVSNTPWKLCEVFDYADVITANYSTGVVKIEVLTPLVVASSSVSSSVQFNVWISGDSDISFAVPNFINHVIGVSTPLTAPTITERNLRRTVAISDLSSLDDNGYVQLADGYSISKDDFMTLFDEETFDENNMTSYVRDNGIYYAQVFNTTDPGISHNEQVNDTSMDFFKMKSSDSTAAEEICIGEKITNLRQIIKRFTPIYTVNANQRNADNLKEFAIPLGIADVNTYNLNTLRLDPSYFGEDSGNVGATFQVYDLPVKFDVATGNFTSASCQVAKYLPNNNPLHYISNIYRFYNGSRRYKFFFSDSRKVNDILTTTTQATTPTATYVYTRESLPYTIVREQSVSINGAIQKPQLIVSDLSIIDSPTFSSIVYPDLNGAIEVEIPYYAITPISIVGQGSITNDEGVLISRSKVFIQQGFGGKDNDYPIYNQTGTTLTSDVSGLVYRYTFNGGTLMTAAGDDFNFGYLIGSPSVKKIGT